MKLTEHFDYDELGVTFADDRVKHNALFLCSTILEPLRAHFGLPVHVTSGYRSGYHNEQAGGKPTSWHLYEDRKAAADVFVDGIGVKEVFDWLRLESKLPFDKVIEEFTGDVARIVHIQAMRPEEGVDAFFANRRLAYTGGTGDAHNYVQVEVA